MPGQFRPPPGYRPPMPPQSRPSLTGAQQMRLALVSAILVVVGVALGFVATIALPHVYAAQTTIRYNLSDRSGDAERTLTTQTVIITGREVLQPVADATGVPVDYLTKNVSAVVVPNSEIIQIQVNHPDRASGMQLANAVAKRYLDVANASGQAAALQAQLDNAQRQLANPATPPATVADLQAQVSDLQGQLAKLATGSNIATVVAPAYSVTAAVFPNTGITLGIGALVGVALAGLVGTRMVRNWTRR